MFKIRYWLNYQLSLQSPVYLCITAPGGFLFPQIEASVRYSKAPINNTAYTIPALIWWTAMAPYTATRVQTPFHVTKKYEGFWTI